MRVEVVPLPINRRLRLATLRQPGEITLRAAGHVKGSLLLTPIRRGGNEFSMPRQLRIEYPGAIYHVMNSDESRAGRGDRREPIFQADAQPTRPELVSKVRTPPMRVHLARVK